MDANTFGIVFKRYTNRLDRQIEKEIEIKIKRVYVNFLVIKHIEEFFFCINKQIEMARFNLIFLVLAKAHSTVISGERFVKREIHMNGHAQMSIEICEFGTYICHVVVAYGIYK